MFVGGSSKSFHISVWVEIGVLIITHNSLKEPLIAKEITFFQKQLSDNLTKEVLKQRKFCIFSFNRGQERGSQGDNWGQRPRSPNSWPWAAAGRRGRPTKGRKGQIRRSKGKADGGEFTGQGQAGDAVERGEGGAREDETDVAKPGHRNEGIVSCTAKKCLNFLKFQHPLSAQLRNLLWPDELAFQDIQLRPSCKLE